MIERLFDLIERCILPVLGALLAFITVGVFIQVVLRYGFSTTFLWGEELSLFAFIWCVFLGAAIGVRRRIHLGFDFLGEMLRGRAAGVQRFLVDAVILTVALLLTIEGWTFSQLGIQRFSPALGITLYIPIIMIPISGALMVLFVLVDLVRDWQKIWSGNDRQPRI